MIRKATVKLTAGQTRAAQLQDRVSEYHAHKHLRELTDITPGHLIRKLLEGENVVYSALPAPDVWDRCTCEYCDKPVFILHSMGPVLVLQKDSIGLMAQRHSCPKMQQHNGKFLS